MTPYAEQARMNELQRRLMLQQQAQAARMGKEGLGVSFDPETGGLGYQKPKG
jgi:hypothetical protein